MLPDLRLRDRVFAEAGIAEAIEKHRLDEFDRDSLYVLARSKDSARLVARFAWLTVAEADALKRAIAKAEAPPAKAEAPPAPGAGAACGG